MRHLIEVFRMFYFPFQVQRSIDNRKDRQVHHLFAIKLDAHAGFLDHLADDCPVQSPFVEYGKGLIFMSRFDHEQHAFLGF